MKVTFWGTRGSLASPGFDTARYGGNTSCVSVEDDEGTLIVLDAGTGIRNLGQSMSPTVNTAHILLTHLHMDHVQGLPFFAPLRRRGAEIHIWGPASTTLGLSARLQKYLSPPLFPVSIRELAAKIHFHELPDHVIEIGSFTIHAQLIIHPNPTIGYRIQASNAVLTYLPDHEPALGGRAFAREPDWTSGYELAEGADLLIHDSQYSEEEYYQRIGFGHSSLGHAFRFATASQVKHFVPFHHDPTHDDDTLDRLFEQAIQEAQPAYKVTPGHEGLTMHVNG